MQSLLLDFCQCHSSDAVLSALLDMLVDGKFDLKSYPTIQVTWYIHIYRSFFDNKPSFHREKLKENTNKSGKAAQRQPTNGEIKYFLDLAVPLCIYDYLNITLSTTLLMQNEDVIILYLSVLQKVRNSFLLYLDKLIFFLHLSTLMLQSENFISMLHYSFFFSFKMFLLLLAFDWAEQWAIAASRA